TVHRWGAVERRNLRLGLFFVSPWLVGLVAFYLYPIASSLYYSFTDYNVLQPATWVGLANYQAIFHDPLFWTALENTLFMVVVGIPIYTVADIAVAILLNTKVPGQTFFRAVVFLPTLIPVVVLSILWQRLLDPQAGLLNNLLGDVSINGPGWFASLQWAKPGFILMSLWGTGNAVVIYLAGLQDVDRTLYEAADVDGANWWHKIWHVTLPSLSPVIMFNVILAIIASFQFFTQAFIITNGGPINATLFYSLYLYQNAFSYLHMGYASGLAWILLVITLVLTVVVLRSSAKWVYYAGNR
ncbi:MAG: carbohydrate transporter rane protein 1, family, partial [Chloroflexi bacterium]|nr:carbohydrate transporter rane protein 1, family [Chloroflexota bacterium]